MPFELVGTVALPIITALSSVAGVGGGGIVVPLIIACFSFDAKKSIAISSFSILSSSIIRFIYTFNHKHPEKDSVIVDYSLVTIMLPTVLIGSYLGVIFNIVFPILFLLIILTLLLLALTVFSTLKSIKMYKTES